MAVVHAVWMACEDDIEVFRRHSDAAAAALESSGLVDGDVGWALELAGSYVAASWPDDAVKAWELARAQLSALGDAVGIARIDAMIGALEGRGL